jgi:CHASE3 domain sensor protein
MAKLRNMKIGKKIGLGFGVMTLILMAVVLFTIQQVRTMEELTKRVISLRTPTAHASLMMLNGVNHSLASLRGWIILGDEKFKEERSLAWTEQIEPSLHAMHELAPDWTDPENKTRLHAIEKEIDAFKKFQQKVEDIAQMPENFPAREILFDTAEPLEKTIVAIVSDMIAVEMKDKTHPDRKRLLEILATIETATSLALERADEFLLSGKQEFKRESLENWQKNVKQLQALQKNEEILTQVQRTDFKKLKSAIVKLGPLLKEIIRIRSGEEWNVANHWVRTQASPVAFRIKEILNEMTEVQDQLLQNDVEEISSRTHFLIALLVALFFAAALASGVLGATITRSISDPIRDASTLASELVQGSFRKKRLPVHAHDELGALCKSFNELLDRLQEGKPSSKK